MPRRAVNLLLRSARPLAPISLTLASTLDDAMRVAALQGDAKTAPYGEGMWPAITNIALSALNTNSTTNVSKVLGTETITAITTPIVLGTGGVQVITPGGSSSEGLFEDYVAVAANTAYLLAVWLNIPVGKTLKLQWNEYTNANGFIQALQGSPISGTGAYQLAFITGTTSGTTAKARVFVFTPTTQAVTFQANALTFCLGSVAIPFTPTSRSASRAQGPASVLNARQMVFAKRFRPESLTGLEGARLGLWKQDTSNLVEMVQEQGLYKMRRTAAGVSEEAAVVAGAVAGTSQLILGVLTPGGPAIALNGGHLRGPVLYDRFQRADGAVGTAPSGQTWQQVPAGDNGNAGITLSTISSNKLVAVDTGQPTTAGYNGIDLGAGNVPTRMSATVVWTAGTAAGGTAGLICNTGGLAHVTQIGAPGSIHIGWTDVSCGIGYFESGVLTQVNGWTYATPLARDGVTQYKVGWSIVGSTLTVEMPDGTVMTVTDAHFATYLGRYCTFENYFNLGNAQPQFLKVQIEQQTATPNTGGGNIPAITATQFDSGSSGDGTGEQCGETVWEMAGSGLAADADPAALNAFGDTIPLAMQIRQGLRTTYLWAGVTSAASAAGQ